MTPTIARALVSSLVVLGLTACLGTVEAATVDKNELKKLQGKWLLASADVDGKPVDKKSLKQSRMTWQGDKITIFAPHQSKDTVTAKVKRLDAKKAPHQVDWSRTTGPGKGKTVQAVYEFDGKNSYRVCSDPSGARRPTGFTPGSGDCHILQVWKRAAK